MVSLDVIVVGTDVNARVQLLKFIFPSILKTFTVTTM